MFRRFFLTLATSSVLVVNASFEISVGYAGKNCTAGNVQGITINYNAACSKELLDSLIRLNATCMSDSTLPLIVPEGSMSLNCTPDLDPNLSLIPL